MWHAVIFKTISVFAVKEKKCFGEQAAKLELLVTWRACPWPKSTVNSVSDMRVPGSAELSFCIRAQVVELSASEGSKAMDCDELSPGSRSDTCITFLTLAFRTKIVLLHDIQPLGLVTALASTKKPPSKYFKVAWFSFETAMVFDCAATASQPVLHWC